MVSGREDTGGPLLTPGRNETIARYRNFPRCRRRRRQRNRGARAQAERAEDTVGRVIGIVVRIGTRLWVVARVSIAMRGVYLGFMRRTITLDASFVRRRCRL